MAELNNTCMQGVKNEVQGFAQKMAKAKELGDSQALEEVKDELELHFYKTQATADRLASAARSFLARVPQLEAILEEINSRYSGELETHIIQVKSSTCRAEIPMPA